MFYCNDSDSFNDCVVILIVEMSNNRCLVLYLSEYKCLSSSCKRTLGLLKGLLQKGYNIDFLTVETDGIQLKNSTYSFLDSINIIPLWKESANNVNVAQVSGIKGVILRKIAQWYRLFFIFGHTYKYAKRIRLEVLPQNSYDIVISISDPKTSHIALGNLLKQGLATDRIIEYWGDPLYGDVSFKSVYPDWVIRNIEYKYLKLANRIVYTSPFTLKAEQQIFPKIAERMISIPTANLEEQVYHPFSSPKIKVGYFGDYYTQFRDIRPLYNAFTNGFENIDIELFIVGDSDMSLVDRENITVLSRRNIDDLQSKTDILICLLNNHGTQIPGKLYYNAGTNLPIVVILDGEYKEDIKKYLDTFDRFIICENNVDSINNAIKSIALNKPVFKPSKLLSPVNTASAMLQ